MRYFKRAADQNHSYAALAYAKMCAESGDMDDASKYAYIAVAYNHKLAVRVGLWSYYDIGNRETGRWYLKYGADRGDRESADALKALDKGQNLNLAFGVLNLLYYACNIIDERVNRYHNGDMSQGVDRKLKKQISKKKQALGMRMG